MRKRKVKLSTKHYNLLLRTLETGSGDIRAMRELIQHQVTEGSKEIGSDAGAPLLLGSSNDKLLTHKATDASQTIDGVTELPMSDVNEDTEDTKTEPSLAVTAPTDNNNDAYTAFNGILVVNSSPDLLSEQTTTNKILDILNAKLKLPADMEIKSIRHSHERLMLLGNTTYIYEY